MQTLPADHAERLERARLALDGLSVGDAFGQHFFFPNADFLILYRKIPEPRWHWTDDTAMALSIVDVLASHGLIDQDDLAVRFAARYDQEPGRGYGGAAQGILLRIGCGQPWRVVSQGVFEGQGSMGNGGAMRSAPIGAYFADDLPRVVLEARRSAEVTHAHAEGQAGAVAVAVAAAWAWRVGTGQEAADPDRLFEVVLEHTPAGETRRGVEQARNHPLDGSPITAARLLGNGSKVTAPDTVPFTIWCAARHLTDYGEAMWTTVAGLGDRDTTCAIVGGVVVLAAGRASIPAEWLRAREPLG